MAAASAADHTVRHFRKELYFPSLFQRKTIDQWLPSPGRKMSHEIAHDRGRGDPGSGGAWVPLPAAVDTRASEEQASNAAVAETRRAWPRTTLKRLDKSCDDHHVPRFQSSQPLRHARYVG